MARLNINVGTTANDKTGDPLRTAFDKVNQNFIEIYDAIEGSSTSNQLVNSSYTVSLDADGNVTVPSGKTIQSGDNSIRVNMTNGLQLSAVESIYFYTNTNSTIKSWQFRNDGKLQLPEGGDIVANDGVTSVLGAGANTGDVTFNGVKIIGSGEASGDGNRYSTLELVPDNNLYANHQYLVIDPTAPSHIHIRAGGPQDSSNAQLIVGGEKNNVSVMDNNGVYLNHETLSSSGFQYTDSVEFTSGSWYEDTGSYYIEFTTTNSELINTFWAFTGMSQNTLVIYDGNDYNTVTYGGTAGAPGNDLYRVKVNEAPPSNPTTIQSLSYTIYTTNYNSISLSNNSLYANVAGEVYIAGADYTTLANNSTTNPVQIVANADNGSQVWNFNTDGKLRLPNNTAIGPALENSSATKITANSGAWVSLENNDGYQSITTDDNQVAVLTNNSNIWRFLKDGKFRFPDGSDQTTAWTGMVDTLSGTYDPAVGTRLTGVKAPDGSGANLGYVWVPTPPELQALGDITGYTISYDQGQWTTTVVQMRDDLGASWAIQTADPFPAYGAGNTYTYTSPDYVAPSPNNLALSVGTNNWTFDTNGGLIFPDSTIQSTAYQLVNPPQYSTGASGDKAGMVAYDADYHYYCKTDYTDGMSNIWVRAAWTGTTW